MIRKLVYTVLMAVVVTPALSQTADSTLYRQNKVKEVRSWVHVLGFENSNDTCLFSFSKINKQGKTTYQKVDYNCQGWDMMNEYYYTYDSSGHLIEMKILQNNAVSQDVKLDVNAHGQVVREQVYFPETDMAPASRSESVHTYFGDAKNPDSSYTTQVANFDTTRTVTTNTYINGKLKKSAIFIRSTRKPVSTLTNRYDQNMRLIRSEYIFFLAYDRDQITKYTYNVKGQVVETNSELDDLRAQFFYNKKGLPMLTHYYNKFGALEREMWNKYTYYE